jgi:hypothetical protein
VISQTADSVVNEGAKAGIAATDAHMAARITYRQLDHWARQGWVLPSVDPGRGRSSRRLYTAGDVVRLDLLRHLAVSKVNLAIAGPEVARLEVPDQDVRVLWGPVGQKEADAGLCVDVPDTVLDHLESGGAWVVYNPAEVRTRIARLMGQPAVTSEGVPAHQRATTRRRRSA